MKGDPTPVCRGCGDYLGDRPDKVQMYDGLLACMPCWSANPDWRNAPTEKDIEDAIAIILRDCPPAVA